MGDFVPAISMRDARGRLCHAAQLHIRLAISTYIGQNIGAGRMDRVKPANARF